MPFCKMLDMDQDLHKHHSSKDSRNITESARIGSAESSDGSSLVKGIGLHSSTRLRRVELILN